MINYPALRIVCTDTFEYTLTLFPRFQTALKLYLESEYIVACIKDGKLVFTGHNYPSQKRKKLNTDMPIDYIVKVHNIDILRALRERSHHNIPITALVPDEDEERFVYLPLLKSEKR